MPVPTDHITLSTPRLEKLNVCAKKRKHERTLSTRFMNRVDPDGEHVIAFNYFMGPEVVRAMIIVQVNEDSKTVYATLDIAITDYLSLLHT